PFSQFRSPFHLLSQLMTTGLHEIPGLAKLPDPRARRGIRHPLAHILVIIICAVIAGAKTLIEIAEWAKDVAPQQLAGYGIAAPHATTIARVLQRLDIQTFELLLADWTQNLRAGTNASKTIKAIAVDGKEVRGAKNGKGTRVHLLSAIDQGTHAVLSQVGVGIKTNEITQFTNLLDHVVELKGAVVTADALHTQKGHAKYLHERESHYIFTVKGNQARLLAELEQLPWDDVPAGNRTTQTQNGRRTIRTVKCATVTTGMSFPHAAQAMQIMRKSRPLGATKWHIEIEHALTSLPTHLAGPGELGAWIQGHWAIENGLHWRRDVTWQEDKSQVRVGNSPHVMATLRNIAITLLKNLGYTNLAKATRKLRNHPDRVLSLIGLGTSR
ncbi:ISAs1 family transposase, partial [Arthrobacter sp. MYb216]|uniref:ISAs1 family transposase n=1 Tax=unclassified Arthrobacter TaxID=235627 RepID=UPI000CFE3626